MLLSEAMCDRSGEGSTVGALYVLRLRAIALALRGARVFSRINELRAVIDRAYSFSVFS